MVAESKQAAASLTSTEFGNLLSEQPNPGYLLRNIEWVEPMERLLCPKKGSRDEMELEAHPWFQNKENLTIEFDFCVHFESTTCF